MIWERDWLIGRKYKVGLKFDFNFHKNDKVGGSKFPKYLQGEYYLKIVLVKSLKSFS